jgi:hypothetical protein
MAVAADADLAVRGGVGHIAGSSFRIGNNFKLSLMLPWSCFIRNRKGQTPAQVAVEHQHTGLWSPANGKLFSVTGRDCLICTGPSQRILSGDIVIAICLNVNIKVTLRKPMLIGPIYEPPSTHALDPYRAWIARKHRQGGFCGTGRLSARLSTLDQGRSITASPAMGQ